VKTGYLIENKKRKKAGATTPLPFINAPFIRLHQNPGKLVGAKRRSRFSGAEGIFIVRPLITAFTDDNFYQPPVPKPEEMS
jgi:hypothetical protein